MWSYLQLITRVTKSIVWVHCASRNVWNDAFDATWWPNFHLSSCHSVKHRHLAELQLVFIKEGPRYNVGQAGHAGGTLPGRGPSWWGGNPQGAAATPNTATVSPCGGPIWPRDTRLSWSMGSIKSIKGDRNLSFSDKNLSSCVCENVSQDESGLGSDRDGDFGIPLIWSVPLCQPWKGQLTQVEPSAGLVMEMVSWRLPKFLLPTTCLLWLTQKEGNQDGVYFWAIFANYL